MNKTQVKVYFSLYGDDFPIDEVTAKLKLTPTETQKKGDLIPNRLNVRYRQETSWNLGTGYQVSLDVNEQLQQIITPLRNKISIINEIKKTYSLECKFFVVVIIEDGNTPALYLYKDVINFASSVEAEFDIDLYANPCDDNFDN